MRDDKILDKAKKTLVRDIRQLLIGLKPEIADDYRCTDDPEDNARATLGLRKSSPVLTNKGEN